MSHSPRVTWLLAGAALLGGHTAPCPLPAQRALEPFELALQAELVVEGLIAYVEHDATRGLPLWARRSRFEVEVGAVLAGFVPGGDDTLEVEQLLEPAEAERYAPYERGQRAVFFLRRPRDRDGALRSAGPWLVLGTAGEGECPVIDAPLTGAQVLFHGEGLQRLQRTSTRAFGHHFYGFSSQRDEFHAMVRGLRRCYEWKPVVASSRSSSRLLFPPETLRRSCTEGELRAFMASSELSRAVVRDARAAPDAARGGA